MPQISIRPAVKADALAIARLFIISSDGLAAHMMNEAETRARALALPRVSRRCFERNEVAQRLCKRLGYRELMRRALVPHPALHYSDGDAVLQVKEL